MTDAEKKQVLQLVFAEVSADHTAENVLVQLKPRPMWEPYVEAVLARQKAPGSAASADTTSERKTGFEPATPSLARTCATAAPLPRTCG